VTVVPVVQVVRLSRSCPPLVRLLLSDPWHQSALSDQRMRMASRPCAPAVEYCRVSEDRDASAVIVDRPLQRGSPAQALGHRSPREFIRPDRVCSFGGYNRMIVVLATVHAVDDEVVV
jgi:hypothetical protein